MTERRVQPVLSNPRSDRVRAVARLSGRSARERTGLFLAEGPQAVREAVAEGDRVRAVYVTTSAAERLGEILDAATDARIDVQVVSDEVFGVMAAGTGTLAPQGIVAVCLQLSSVLDDVLSTAPRLVAVLSQVRDPGNAGAVIRAADAAGAGAVVLTDASVDVHNPKAVRATAGSLFHLPVVTGVPLAEAVGKLRAAGMWVLAADREGPLDLDDLADDAGTGVTAGLAGPVAWIFGNEAWGLPDGDRDLADAVVRVPVHGRAESLNLATAATVCLYFTARAQRRRAQERVVDV